MRLQRSRRLSRLATALVLTGAAVWPTLSGCSSSSESGAAASTSPSPPTLSLLVPDSGCAQGLLEGLRHRNPRFVVRVQEYAAESDLAALLGDAGPTDVVLLPAGTTARRLARSGLLRLVISRIEQWDRVSPVLKRVPGVAVGGRLYMGPLGTRPLGVVYDRGAVTARPTSFADSSTLASPAGSPWKTTPPPRS